MNGYEEVFAKEVQELCERHLYRSVTLPRGLEFQHNDYLGLSTHLEVLEAMASAVSVVGAGSRGSRLLGGHSFLFDQTEEKICEYFNAPAALLFSSGYMANLAAMQVLSECMDQIYSDQFNHASLIDGLRLGKARCTIVPHQKWNDVPDSNSKKLFVSEAVFSMEGTLLRTDSFLQRAKACQAYTHVDEAHSAGVFFKEGKGLELARELGWNNSSVTVTFGKAFGLSSAAILGSKSLIELLVNKARTFIFTTAPSPIVLIGLQKVLEVASLEAWRREELWERAEKVREILKDHLPKCDSTWQRRVPIISVPVSGAERALSFARNMREFGFDVRAIRYPTVPVGTERIRVTLNLAVSRDNTFLLAEHLKRELEKG